MSMTNMITMKKVMKRMSTSMKKTSMSMERKVTKMNTTTVNTAWSRLKKNLLKA